MHPRTVQLASRAWPRLCPELASLAPCCAEAALLRWKDALVQADGANADRLASWVDSADPLCDPLTLACSWVGVKCQNFTVAPRRRRAGVLEM